MSKANIQEYLQTEQSDRLNINQQQKQSKCHLSLFSSNFESLFIGTELTDKIIRRAQLLYASRQFDLQISDFMTHEILLQAYLLMMPNLVKPDKGELGIFNKISESNWEADLEGLPPHEDVHVRLCLPQKSKTINNALEEQNSKKKARKIAHFKRPSPTKLFIAGDFVPYSVQLTEGLQLDTNNGILFFIKYQIKSNMDSRVLEAYFFNYMLVKTFPRFKIGVKKQKISRQESMNYQFIEMVNKINQQKHNGIEEKVRQKKEDERQRIIEEKRKQDEELRIQQEAQTELMRQLDAIKGKQFTFDQKGNVILQDFVNFNHLPNPLLNIKHIGESETLKINNKFEKSIKLELKAPLKNQTIKEMLNQIPIVISKPQPIPAGSFFEVMNPGIGVKIKEGKITKEQDEPYEKYYGKTSRAAYMLKQEKDGLFQSSMKEQAQLKSNNGSIKDQSSPKRHSQIFTERLSEIGEVDQSSIALDMKKSKGRIYFKKPQALNDLINTTINQQQCFKLITIMNNTKQLTLKNQSIKSKQNNAQNSYKFDVAQTARVFDEHKVKSFDVKSEFLHSLKARQQTKRIIQTQQGSRINSYNQKSSSGFNTQRETCNNNNFGLTESNDKGDNPMQLNNELNQMILLNKVKINVQNFKVKYQSFLVINSEKWGTISGQLSIQNAFNMTQQPRPKTRQPTYIHHSRQGSSQSSHRQLGTASQNSQGFLNRRNKKSVPKINFENLIRNDEPDIYTQRHLQVPSKTLQIIFKVFQI